MYVFEHFQIQEVIAAIRELRAEIRWKPDKAALHLTKRIRLGHLPSDATLDQYEAIIAAVVRNPEAQLYIFVYGKIVYPTIVALVDNKLWLVMMGINGVLETAFPPDDPESYLADSSFVYLGLLSDLES
jgi:hypothetical protein